ncbi:MAG: diguanylate cyclase [Bacteroidales bacterium]|nr:diguanylate cyclase [Bacteroidales bacterium]MCR5114457.1 diguanylate cyclase [Bacteroidales bacterium]
MLKYFQKAPISVTICDKDGKILEMSDKAIATLTRDGKSLVGANLLDCHPEPARSKLVAMLQNHNVNAYTIEKNGVKKLIYQMPWYEDEVFAGYIELSMEIPFEMPHYVRQPRP